MIDSSVAMVLVGAAIQAVPPTCRLLVHIRCRPRIASALGTPART